MPVGLVDSAIVRMSSIFMVVEAKRISSVLCIAALVFTRLVDRPVIANACGRAAIG